jgi:hypothetical protein
MLSIEAITFQQSLRLTLVIASWWTIKPIKRCLGKVVEAMMKRQITVQLIVMIFAWREAIFPRSRMAVPEVMVEMGLTNSIDLLSTEGTYTDNLSKLNEKSL